MIRIRHENVVPVIVDSVYEEYEYKIRNGDIYSHETEMKAIISDAVAKQLIEEITDD